LQSSDHRPHRTASRSWTRPKIHSVQICDARSFKLGVHPPPVRASGDIKDTPVCTLEYPDRQRGELSAASSASLRHLHMTPRMRSAGVRDKSFVLVRLAAIAI